MYYLFYDQDFYSVTSDTHCISWFETAVEAYEEWVVYGTADTFDYDGELVYCLENFTLVASSEDITTLFHSCPELLL